MSKKGLCFCGCGLETGKWSRNDFGRGRIKGEYKKYIAGHKLPPSFKGVKRSTQDRERKSVAALKRVKNGTHNFWKGGITDKNNRKSSVLRRLKDQVLERDGHRCTWCNEDNVSLLQSHHKMPFNRYPKLRYKIENLVTICKECHKKTLSYGGNMQKYIFKKEVEEFVPGKTRISYGGAIINQAEVDAIIAVIENQGGKRWTVGPESIAFEEELAQKTGVKRAVVVNSGSSALLVALTALRLEKGSKVIIPAVNFPTAFNAILQCGLVPYVVDVDPKTLNLDLEEVRKAVQNEKIDAVIAVNIASNPNDLDKIRDIVGDNTYIILDNCDGYGTLWNGEFVEKKADISCVSFHAAHIITTGEGGACLTDNEELANRMKKLREWGRADGTDEIYDYPGFPEDYRSRYVYEEIGFNMKPLELQCAMGRIQLKKLENFREARLRNATKMRAIFEKYPQFQLIESPDNAEVCWFSFPLLCKGISRKKVMDTLEANNIECRTIFSGNILKHPAYKDTKYVSHGEMVNADMVMKDGMFLSVHPSITDEMLDFIDKVLGELCK